MSRPSRAVSDYMAEIGSKGGKAKGKRKARSAEHYAAMVRAREGKRLGFPGKPRNKAKDKERLSSIIKETSRETS